MDKNTDLSQFSMLHLFAMEIETQTTVLTENLLALEEHLRQGKTNSEINPILEALMRAAHSIKGAARILQIEAAVKISHVMEDCFFAAMENKIILKSEDIDCLFQGVDFLQKIAQLEELQLATWLAQQQESIENIVNNIHQIISQSIIEKNIIISPEKEQKQGEQEDNYLAHIQAEFIPEYHLETDDSESSIELSSMFLEAQEIPPPPKEVNATISGGLESVPSTTLAKAKNRYVRVSADNLSRLLGLAGEALVEATSLTPFADSLSILKKNQIELSHLLEKFQSNLISYELDEENAQMLRLIIEKERECREILSDRIGALEQFAYRSINLSDRLYREVIASHMRPFSEGVQGFPRMIRDLAKQMKKLVKLEIMGQSTPVDRDILKKLEAPLTHILRNALDHGIESPEERRRQGKPAEGTIRLEAVHRFGMLSITVADDGQGINLEDLRQKVVDKQLVKPDIAKQLTENELLEFIFLPGFSTCSQVTEISGRGVGLNVAKMMVEEVGGNIQAISKFGKGTSFHFQLPLTLSVIRTLLVEISGEPYAFPLTRIDQVVMLHKEDISYVENRQYFTLNGQHIALVRADKALDLTPSRHEIELLPVIIISDQLNHYGLVVDRFLGERNLVIRPLDPRLGKVQNISAAALLEDGSPVLILDVLDLLHSVDTLLTSSDLSYDNYELEGESNRPQKKILVVDDSITVREMERKLLQNHGYEVDVATDGIEGWNMVVRSNYDLVITDVDMPRMNGIKLVTQLKNNLQLKSIPVIIVSYKDREEDRLQGMDAGADYYLTKSSFHDDTLINAVIDLIGK